jgi:hypothetical protein
MAEQKQENKPRYPRNPGFTGSEKDTPPPTEKSPNQLIAEMNIADRAAASARRLVERKAPELFQFKAEGDLLEGVLLRLDAISIKDKSTHQPKRVSQYTFRKENGDVVKMLGTYDIDCKILLTDLGHFIEIAYIGENKEVRRGDNFMKIFRVKVEEKSAAPTSNKFTDGTEITDEDIPF